MTRFLSKTSFQKAAKAMNELSFPTLSDGERAALNFKLWKLLEKRTALYTSGSVCALPYETVQALFDSIVYTLSLESDCDAANRFVYGDADTLYAEGERRIAQKLEEFDALWNTACLCIPPFAGYSMRSTLKSIGGFKGRYDYRRFANLIPCDIDYQLCFPVPETLCGVDYVNEYMRRLITENRFLARFDENDAKRVLALSCSDYSELILNLYSPVAANALGCMLAGKSPLPPFLSALDGENIRRSLCPLGRSRLSTVLSGAAQGASDILGLSPPERGLLSAFAASLVPELLASDGRGAFFTEL